MEAVSAYINLSFAKKKISIQLSNYTNLEDIKVELSSFFAFWRLFGHVYSTEIPHAKTKTNQLLRFFSIDGQCYVGGGLLKDTFFKIDFLLYKKSSELDKIRWWQWQQ